MPSKRTKPVVIVGGGAIGLSLAFHLARHGQSPTVTLLERNQLASGTSWHAAGIIGPLRATPLMTRMTKEALEGIPKLEQLTGLATGFRTTGGYWIGRRPERMTELRRIAAIGRLLGLEPTVLSTDDLALRLPGLNMSEISGALAVAEDATVNPYDLCMAYARAARGNGVVIREHAPVERILVRDGCVSGVRLADGEEIRAGTVALCAGAWSGQLAEAAGMALPLQAVEHMYVVTEPVAGLSVPFPVVRDLDRQIYMKGDAGRLVIGGFEWNAKPWDPYGPEGDREFLELPEDWEQFSPFMDAALDLVPALQRTGIQRFMNGPESFTSDSRPLVGEVPEISGLYVAAGMNSVGIMSSYGIGRALADWIVDGFPGEDLWEISIARADPKTASRQHMRARMAEAVADVMAMHWPYKQPRAGRNLRTSVLHRHWEERGAVFGVTGGWERGLWHVLSAEERELPPSYGSQPWYPIAEREARAMADGVALIDLSPFTKIDVTGPDAGAFIHRVCAGRVDLEPGGIAYTLMLNDRGGIEADATVTRTGSSAFRIVLAAGLRWKELGRLRRHARGMDVSINDATESEVVIGTAGPRSRETLSEIADSDWGAFPFMTSRQVEIAGRSVRANRVSFTGERGWEIFARIEDVPLVFDALSATGAGHLGYFALDGCRMEKAFRHWGHDIGPDLVPGEAGLGFTVRRGGTDRPFIGEQALERRKPVTRRLMLLHLAGEPLSLHDEPILEHGRPVGLTTSGAQGPRTGLSLAFGLIDIAAGEPLVVTCQRQLEVDIGGDLYRAIPLPRPPYDPEGERMRA
ncbi:MAG: FAD-dependent oxidoreductase [Rhodobacteraceae bacterium]|nr:FAD-dependent oxidoreductase [Paracoccaceae bacterium]